MLSKSLVDLNSEWFQMESLLNTSGGVLTEEQEKLFDELVTALAEKREAYIYVRENVDSQIEQGKKWIKKFQEKVKQLENRKARLDNAVIYSLTNQSIDSQETELGKIRVQKSKSANIYNDDDLPAKYKKIVQETRIDKKQILADLKSGEDVPGAELVENEYIRIY